MGPFFLSWNSGMQMESESGEKYTNEKVASANLQEHD